MNNLIFDMCYVTILVSCFAVMISVCGWVFEFICKHIHAFGTWVNNLIGIEDDEDE